MKSTAQGRLGRRAVDFLMGKSQINLHNSWWYFEILCDIIILVLYEIRKDRLNHVSVDFDSLGNHSGDC